MTTSMLLAALLSTANPDPELITQIEWPLTVKVSRDLVIRSYFSNFSKKDVIGVARNYARSILNFYAFYGIECDLKPLEIRIISEGKMNDPKHFAYIDPVIYGRYFRENEHIYLTLEATKNKKYFAHEMAHYLYDVCNMKFSSSKEEHKEIDKFLKDFK